MCFTAFLKKYYPGLLFILIAILFLFLSEPPEPAVETADVSQLLIIESYSLETVTEALTEPETESETELESSEPPESVLLEDVPYYSQKNLLPTGCEIVSAKMLLDYYVQKDTDIQNIVDLLNCQYPKQVDGKLCAPHPEDAFIGIPLEDSGFGCYAPVIVKALNKLLPKRWQAEDISGTNLPEIAETYLPQGKPVLVWATINMWQTSVTHGWYVVDKKGKPTDKWFDWLVNEHCMVLVGYDTDKYYFNDPYNSNGLISFNRELVEDRYEQIGKYAAVVTEKPKEDKHQK